jgi:hypothetical protein
LTISVVLIRGLAGCAEALPALSPVALFGFGELSPRSAVLFACGEAFPVSGVEVVCANALAPLVSNVTMIANRRKKLAVGAICRNKLTVGPPLKPLASNGLGADRGQNMAAKRVQTGKAGQLRGGGNQSGALLGVKRT